MRGFSSALLLLRQLQIVLLREYYFILLPQQSIFAQINLQGLYPLTLLFIFSHCTIPFLMFWVNSSLFQVVFTFLAIRQRNTIQIIGLVIFNAAFVAYSAVQVPHSLRTIFSDVFPPTRLLKFPMKSNIILTKTSTKN